MKSLCRVRLLATPWTAAYQAPSSIGFSRQEYWSGLPLPSPMPRVKVIYYAGFCSFQFPKPHIATMIPGVIRDHIHSHISLTLYYKTSIASENLLRGTSLVVQWFNTGGTVSIPGWGKKKAYLVISWNFQVSLTMLAGFPSGSEGKASTCNAGNPGSLPGWGRSPGEGNGNPFPIFLPGESHRQRSLVGYSPQGCKESDTTEQLHFQLLTMLVSKFFQCQ